MQKSVGLIGVGHMGHGIALNIVKKGWPLSLLDHPGNQPTDDLIALGATTITSPEQLARNSDIIILCVTGSPQVEAIMQGDTLNALRSDATVIDCSTSLPATSCTLATELAQKGISFLDAPMTRTPKEAAEGRLNLLVGGNPETLETLRPLLNCFAENITHAGPVGAGHSMKLLHNYVSLGFIAVLAEAAAAAQASGVSPEVFQDVLAKGGGASAALERVTPFLMQGDASNLRFSIANAAKDLGYYTDMTQEQQSRDAIAKAIADTLSRQVTAGHGDLYTPELISLLQKS